MIKMVAFFMGRRDRSRVPVKTWWDEGPVPVSQKNFLFALNFFLTLVVLSSEKQIEGDVIQHDRT